MTVRLGNGIQGFGAMGSFIVLGILYTYIHCLSAATTEHVAALYAPFAATATAAGAPPMMITICFGILGNLIWGNTKYDGGPGSIYFTQGYSERPRFHEINLCVVMASMIIIFTVGTLWWKLLGYYQSTRPFDLQ